MYLSLTISLSERMRRMAIGFLLIPFTASIVAAVAGVFSHWVGNVFFIVGSVTFLAIALVFVLIAIIVAGASDAGMPGAAAQKP